MIRARIIDAASDLFARHGYHAVSTSDIAKRAGVNQVTLFRRFRTKESIANAVMNKTIDQARAKKIADAICRCPDIESTAKLASSYYAHALSSKFTRLQLLIALEVPHAKFFRLPIIRKAFTKVIEREQNKGKVKRMDPAHMERALNYLVYGLAVVRAFKNDPISQPSLDDIKGFCDIWLNGVVRKCK